MIRRFSFLGALSGIILLCVTTAHAGGDFPKDVDQLNRVTGNLPLAGTLKILQDDPAQTKKLLAKALPLTVQKGKLSYNGALVLALAAAELKDLKTAEAFFRVCIDHAVALQSAEKLLEAYSPLIGHYLQNKQYDQAVRLCKELLELKSDDGKDREVLVPSVNNFGEIEYNPYDRFDIAGRLRPGVHRILIETITKSGDYKQAIKLVDNLLKASDHWQELELKGWVLKEAGQLEEAAKVYQNVIDEVTKDKDLDNDRRDPKKRERYLFRYNYTLSNIYVDMKNIDKATEILQQLIKQRPDSAGLHNDLGYIWADHDTKLDEAEVLIRKALELDKKRRQFEKVPPEEDRDNGAYLDSLAWVLYKKKNYKEAKDVLLKAIEDKESQHIEIYDHLGDVYLALGQREEAVKAWQRGLEVVSEGRREAERKTIVEKKIEKHKK